MWHRKYRMGDDSVTKRGRGRSEYAGKSVTHRGEDARKEGPEPGRYDVENEGADRGPGKSTARDATSVNPQDPIDPRSPYLLSP